jgi:hypothetical protein
MFGKPRCLNIKNMIMLHDYLKEAFKSIKIRKIFLGFHITGQSKVSVMPDLGRHPEKTTS